MIVPHPLELEFGRHWPPGRWRDVTVVLAVSGGADSVALTRLARANQGSGSGELIVAHFDHGLRGAASRRDARFVERLSGQLQLRCLTGVADPAAARGSEQSARTARYQFLETVARSQGARYLVTAHTADDQAETVLHRVVRGTGLAGLAGIPRARQLTPHVGLLRPLLGFRRAQLRAYLADLGQPFCRDDSNDDLTRTRNHLRHRLLPELERCYNPQVVPALLRLADMAKETAEWLAAESAELLDECLEQRQSGRAVLRCPPLQGRPPLLVRQLLLLLWHQQAWPQQAMSNSRWRELAELALAAPRQSARRIDLPGGVRAEKRGELLLLTRPAS